MRFRTLIFALLAVHVGVTFSFAANWITAPSFYTHDPNTGERITQYSPIGPFYIYPRPDFVRSGYRQLRSTLRGGGSADYMHIVEE